MNYEFNVTQFKKILEEYKEDLKELVYRYDILGILFDFRITPKGNISCLDTLANRVYFRANSKYTFPVEGFEMHGKDFDILEFIKNKRGK